MKRYTVRAVLVAMVAALLSSSLAIGVKSSSSTHTPEMDEDEAVIRANVNLVTVYATVNDPTGYFISGLRLEDFEVFDNDIRQQIEYFTEEDVPISMGILFDTSSSMKDRLARSSQALRRFLATSNKDDEFFLLTFNNTINLTHDFTSSSERIVNSLLDITPTGLTAFHDAVYGGIEKVRCGKYPKRALLVISDGQDNSSWYTRPELADFLREANVQLYAISVPLEVNNPAQGWLEREGRDTLKLLTSLTGGRALFPQSMNELDTMIGTVRSELRHQYSIGFTPSGGLDGRWHKLKVKIKDTAKKNIAVRCRAGYQARVQR
ncbi:MAG: VWA domain-containing protein [Acidobacteriota bacterium]